MEVDPSFYRKIFRDEEHLWSTRFENKQQWRIIVQSGMICSTQLDSMIVLQLHATKLEKQLFCSGIVN